jgi:REP element-mobilizing transposase RayT
MPRVPRGHLSDCTFFHVTARGTGGIDIFLEDLDRADFLDLFTSTAERFAWVCHVICLMNTHYHVIVEAPQPRISGGMQRLNGTYARRFNRRHERRGHLFESRFVSWVVRDERHLTLACRYVLNNPVRAGLCRTAEDWPWSSARR